MELFREHEKEFKKKQFSKKALLNTDRGSGNANSYNDSRDGSEYGDEDQNEDEKDYSGNDSGEDGDTQKQRNIEFLQEVNQFMKDQIIKMEGDLENAKNKKNKGTLKKQKEKVGAINYKLTQAKKYRDKIEELTQQMDMIEGHQIRNLKQVLSDYMQNPDE